MITKIKELIVRHREILLYIIFGGMTTLVNYLVYLPLYNSIGISASVCNIIAWFFSVVFAFFTNKPFVFKSNDWSPKTVLKEIITFFSCRIGSGLAETVIIFLTVDMMHWNGNIWKLLTSVLVVILNYFFSKWMVFRK